MKVVINRCFGGFSLSEKAYEYLGIPWDGYGYALGRDAHNLVKDRTNPKLVECVETLGAEANGWAADLKVVTIPDDVEWYISDYDGLETVCEKHRVWD